jgi:hypothetical protein
LKISKSQNPIPPFNFETPILPQLIQYTPFASPVLPHQNRLELRF